MDKFVDMFVMVLGQINSVSFVFETLRNKESKLSLDIVACVLAYADGLSSSHVPNHHAEISSSYVIIDQSPYKEFYHTSRYPLAGILHNSQYYLRAHFGQIEILSSNVDYIFIIKN